MTTAKVLSATEYSALLWSACKAADGTGNVSKDHKKKKLCKFCSHCYQGGPQLIHTHLDGNRKPRDIAACKPTAEFQDEHRITLAELRAYDAFRTQEAQRKKGAEEARETVRQVHAQKTPFTITTREAVEEQAMIYIIKKGAPLDTVDDPEFRKLLHTVAKCGPAFLDASGANGISLPSRKTFTTKLLCNTDTKLDKEMVEKLAPITQKVGGTILSDGWTSTANLSIVNILLGTLAGTRLLKATDMSGQTKTMRDIADLIIEEIQNIGPENVVGVCMDGACRGAFIFIEQEYPRIFCFICPTHSLDGFIKNVLSDKEIITVAGCPHKNLVQQVINVPCHVNH